MVSAHEIDILISTYNGEKYLVEQLESIIAQDINDWHILIRDDESTDESVSIIEEYVLRYPDKITIITGPLCRLGILGSFEHLIEMSTARYVAFCDQDDVWSPDKLLLQVEKMRELEMIHGDLKPILVHTDLSVVDDRLELINESFWKYQHLNPDKMSSLPRMLIQNCVTGCTVLINRPLIVLALPFPKGVIMHDWWMALIAVSEGVVCDMTTSTVKYRQHDNNDTGARQWNLDFIMRGIGQGREPQLLSLVKTQIQAEALISTGVLSDVNRRIVEKYISLYSKNWFIRRIEMLRMGFFKYGVIRNIALFLRI